MVEQFNLIEFDILFDPGHGCRVTIWYNDEKNDSLVKPLVEYLKLDAVAISNCYRGHTEMNVVKVSNIIADYAIQIAAQGYQTKTMLEMAQSKQ